MNRRAIILCLTTLCVILFVSQFLYATGKPDVTRHEANFLERAVNLHIEWQSSNPVVLVRISIANKQQDIKVDPYDNKRNRDGYGGEVNITVGLDWIPYQPFNYVIQLEDELRIKSSLVTGKVRVPQVQQPAMVIQPQQPGMQIQIQQNIPQPAPQPSLPPQSGGQPSAQQGAQPSVQSGGQQVGALVVIIAPQSVADAGAMWRVGSGEWKRSGETIPNLPVGIHTLEFQQVGGWTRPENQKVMIEQGTIITINGIYNQ